MHGRDPYSLRSASLSRRGLAHLDIRTEVEKWPLITGQDREIHRGSQTSHMAGRRWLNGWVDLQVWT